MLQLILLLTAAGFISFSVTYLVMRYGKKKMLSFPNERSLHETPTPKGGGIAIVVSWYAGITVLYFSGVIEMSLWLALMSGILIAAISLIDDIFGVKPVIRLVIHFITAIIAFMFLNGLRQLIIPEISFNYNYVVYPIAIIGIVWFINLFNFMDGVDGFASVEAIFTAGVLAILTWNPATFLLIVCVGGFLCWNWPRAKIFMGDTGSTQLGFILVIMGIYFHNSYEFSIINWIMLTSPFWFDATLTLFRRWKNGEKLSVAHRKHVYQRIVRSGVSHAGVNFMLIAINILIILLIVLYRLCKPLQIPVFIFTISLYYLITRITDRKVPFFEDNGINHRSN